MAYRLKLPYRIKQLHPVFNAVKLTPAPDDPITGRKTEDHPPPIVIDGEAEWEVEEIPIMKPLISYTLHNHQQRNPTLQGFGEGYAF